MLNKSPDNGLEGEEQKAVKSMLIQSDKRMHELMIKFHPIFEYLFEMFSLVSVRNSIE